MQKKKLSINLLYLKYGMVLNSDCVSVYRAFIWEGSFMSLGEIVTITTDGRIDVRNKRCCGVFYLFSTKVIRVNRDN
jgi:hypothetical protein